MTNEVNPKKRVLADEECGDFIENKIAENNGYSLYLFEETNPCVDLIVDSLTFEEIKKYFPDVELQEGRKYSVFDSEGTLVYNDEYESLMPM